MVWVGLSSAHSGEAGSIAGGRPKCSRVTPAQFLSALYKRVGEKSGTCIAHKARQTGEAGPYFWYILPHYIGIAMLQPISCTTCPLQSQHSETHSRILTGLPSAKKDLRGSSSTRCASSIRSTTCCALWMPRQGLQPRRQLPAGPDGRSSLARGQSNTSIATQVLSRGIR